MNFSQLRHAACAALLVSLAGCGGDSSSMSSGAAPTTQQLGTLPIILSDASSDDWATIGVNVSSIALIPQAGGDDVTVYTASGSSYVNLEELDQLGELIGNAQVPVGTYTGAIVTISANPGDVELVTSEDPEPGFPAAASTPIPSASIRIQGAQGSVGSLTVPVKVSFVTPLTVTGSSSNALDLEFDLSHPAFIVAHQPPAAGTLLWAVNFRGPLRHHPIADITTLVLRHAYATLNSISTDGSTLEVTRVHPTRPIVAPETAVAGKQTLKIMVDSTNGTLFYDVDSHSGATTIKSFNNVTGLSTGAYLRIAARYQADGRLIATRIWASSQFNSVWFSPEGHVSHVDAVNGILWVTKESGGHVALSIDANTQFFYHGGTTAIGSGPSFLTNIVRGFKVHVSVVDPLATPLVAQSVDIEHAAYSGVISAASSSSFTYTHDYLRASDDYSLALDYATAGTDVSGKPIGPFRYWDFAYPTLAISGSSAISDFEQATGGAIKAVGVSGAVWGGPANMSGWSAQYTVLLPVPLGLAAISSTSGLSNDSFGITTVGSSTSYTVDFSHSGGQATLVYQVDRSGGSVTISSIDITTSAGLTTFENALTASGTVVKAFGTPNADGSLQAYVVLYFTGDTMPTS